MKLLLLTENGGTVEEYPWGDVDFSDAAIKELALRALENFYDTSGDGLVPKGATRPVPVSARVDDGKRVHHWTVVDLAKSLGKKYP
jgi:hypothetical protein